MKKVVNASLMKLDGVEVVKECNAKEEILEYLDKCEENIDSLVFSDVLAGDVLNRELVLTLRMRYPSVQIVFLISEKNDREKSFLYHWMVFDVLEDPSPSDIVRSIHNPKALQDVWTNYGKISCGCNGCRIGD